MISLLLAAIAAFFNAIMDSVENEHINDTIWWPHNEENNPDRKVWGLSVNKFWYKRMTAHTDKHIFGWKLDAWHISKSLMILFYALAIVFYRQLFANPWINLALVIAVIIIVFNLFYNKIFRKS